MFQPADSQCNTVPPQVENSLHNVTGSPPFAEGTAARYSCLDGYSIEGSIFARCQGAVWDGPDFTCSEILCGLVNTPAHGRVLNEPSYRIGSMITFGCAEGFDLVGQGTLNCRSNGQWSPSPPSCEAKDCGVLPTIDNAHTFQATSPNGENHYGSRVRVTCDSNYILNGNMYVECTAAGTWSDRPTCREITCPPYPGLNTSCVANTLFLSNTLYISCDNSENASFTKVGPSSVVCQASGWNDLTLACYCDCKLPVSTIVTYQNLNGKHFLPHNHTLEWNCAPGYEKQTLETAKCEDGQLVLSNGMSAYDQYHSVVESNLCRSLSTTPSTTKSADENMSDDHKTTKNLTDKNYNFNINPKSGCMAYSFLNKFVYLLVAFCLNLEL